MPAVVLDPFDIVELESDVPVPPPFIVEAHMVWPLAIVIVPPLHLPDEPPLLFARPAELPHPASVNPRSTANIAALFGPVNLCM